jgi:BirA family transcriptional regulator, biotin operon repressor / biotin---[acetyl-CoA-carboxylase] ligase
MPPAWKPLGLSDPTVAETGRWSVWFVAETGSTNTDLLALSDCPDRTVLVAGHQTAGRGRLDRTWDAPPGANLLTSILFRDVPDDPGQLTRSIGVAAVDAVAAVVGVEARLKWPNDVLLDGRKLAGILAQRSPDGAVVVGIGLNVHWAPEGAARLGPDVEPLTVLTELLRALRSQGTDIHERYRALLDTLGRRVRVELPSGDIVGRAVDVARDGSLHVVDECAITHHVDAGDVVHLRDV